MKKSNFIIIGFVVLACLSLTLILFKKKAIFSSSGKASEKEEIFIEDQSVNADSTAPTATVKLSGELTESSSGLKEKPDQKTENNSRANYSRKNLLFEYTAESSNCLTSLAERSLTSWNSLGACCSYSIQRSSDYARAGKFSVRYELHNTDDDIAGSKRAESSRYTLDEPDGKIERWYGASYYLPDDYVYDKAPEIVTQWQSTKGVSPPLALWTSGGKWLIVQHLNTSFAPNSLKPASVDVGEYAKNKWTDFVFHVKWSTGPDGLIEVWKDGVKVFTKSGENTFFDILPGNYMKVGIYKWPWKKTDKYQSDTNKRVLYIDEVRIGDEAATYDDVAPRD